jgi:thioredoxin reductase (NADPH)
MTGTHSRQAAGERVENQLSPKLSAAQLEVFAAVGEERSAAAGETLWDVGDPHNPFVVILEGEAAIVDPAGHEVVRHSTDGFLGEMNVLTGQAAFLRAVATEPLRYLAVERQALRTLLTENGPLADLVLTTLIARREMLQQREGLGVEVIGSRASESTRALLDYLRRARLPHTWRDPEHDAQAHEAVVDLAEEELPLVRLPGGAELRSPSNGAVSRALGIGLELAPRETVDLVIVGGGPAGLGAAVYGASEGLDTLVIESTVLGGQAGISRRIENYLGFPAGISGTELTSRAVTQARKFGARTATPYRVLELVPGDTHHTIRLEGGHEVVAPAVVLATGAEYRRLPVADIHDYEGLSVFYAAGPVEAQRCGGNRVLVVGGGNSAAQAAIWLARGGALVTLLHRRADLRETMSDYLIGDLPRYGVEVRDRSEIGELHGTDGQLEAVTLLDGTRLPASYLFLFLGADPCTDWLRETIRCDASGFVQTGTDVGADNLYETSVPGVFAVGDVRCGSLKRAATAVGEGAAVVRLVHDRLAVAQPR